MHFSCQLKFSSAGVVGGRQNRRRAARNSLRVMNTNGVQTEWKRTNWSLIGSHDDESSNPRMTKKRELQVVIASAIIEKGKMVRLRILAERHSIRLIR